VTAVVNFAAKVEPEFLGEVAEGVERDAGTPDRQGAANIALIVGVAGWFVEHP
jgi:hypothetical protein